LGGHTARTTYPNWPKGYSIPYNIMPSKKVVEKRLKLLASKVTVAQRLAGHQSAVGGGE